MRVLRITCLALLAMALLPNVTEARSRWGFSFGYNSGGYCRPGGGLSIGYGYSYGYRPSFVYNNYSRAYCPPVYYAPRYEPAYCPPPRAIYYSTPRFYDSYDDGYGYAAPVYYGTPRFADRSFVTVNYSSGYRGYDRGYSYVDRNYSYVDRNYSYVDRNYSYCQPAKSYGYSSYYRR